MVPSRSTWRGAYLDAGLSIVVCAHDRDVARRLLHRLGDEMLAPEPDVH